MLADGLSECSADDCKRVLNLRNTVDERRIGLGFVIWVQCECGEINRLLTGKCHRNKSKGVLIYDVNTKTAEGMLHAGLSQTAVERFLSTIQVPPPDHKTLKCRKREVGSVIEHVADETCQRALLLEGMLTADGSSECPVDLVASYDMGDGHLQRVCSCVR